MKAVFRKDTVEFQQTFKDGATPLVPKNSNYPQYSIIDPSNTTVQNGTGTLVAAGEYKTTWLVPEDATLSNSTTANWRISWLFIDENNKQYTNAEEV